MRRKDFLSLFPGLAALPAITPEAASRLKTPPFLQPGDVIGFTSPAGYITLEEVEPARKQIDSWGFVVRMGRTIGRRDCTFGGTDEERRLDLQQMIDDPSVKAIMCARGGYGVNRILDQLDLKPLKKHPKWIIGFSDITALHLHVYRQAHIASIHSKMCNSFPADWETAEPIQQETILSIRNLLEGRPMVYSALPDGNNRLGDADGPLIGGNLAIIASMMGTASEIKTEGAILFLEEVGEYAYSVDRMLTTLQRAGKLSKLKGLVIGGFRMKPETMGEEFGRDLYDIVLSKLPANGYPVCFGFPVGHQKPNYALACGRMHRLTVMPEGVVLRQQ